MRILLVTQWFDPEPTFKGMLFARELRRLGHEVQVLTGFPNYPGGKVYPGYRIRPWLNEMIEDIPITRVALYPSHSRSAFGRIANYLSYAATASIAALMLHRPDVVYLYHPPGSAALPAMILRCLKGVPFVVDVQDLWPDTLSATGMLSNRKALAIVAWWMRRVYRAASQIGVLSHGFRRVIAERGIPEAKIAVIPNWTYEGAPSYPEHERPLPELEENDRINIVFAGTMGKAQALETILDAAGIVEDAYPAVRFVFIGGGIEAEHLHAEARRRNLANVLFLSRRPPSAMPAIFARADFLLVHLKDDPLFAITIPGKTQAYLQAGRPLLMGVRGDAAEMVRSAGAGLTFDPENSASLATALDAALALDPASRARMGAAGAEYYRRELALDVGTRRWSGLLERAYLADRQGFGIKRLADGLVALLVLVGMSPIIAVVALLVATQLGRPVLFSQERPGRFGASFRMYKFRTMTEARGPDNTLLPDAERLTRFGAFLRSTSLDELPGLINVLKGEMSLVGPRPLLHRYTAHFTEEERLRLLVRPGITGLAQVSGRNLVSWDERLAMDAAYVRRWSLWLDLRILARTVVQVLRRRDVVTVPVSIMQDLDQERSKESAQ